MCLMSHTSLRTASARCLGSIIILCSLSSIGSPCQILGFTPSSQQHCPALEHQQFSNLAPMATLNSLLNTPPHAPAVVHPQTVRAFRCDILRTSLTLISVGRPKAPIRRNRHHRQAPRRRSGVEDSRSTESDVSSDTSRDIADTLSTDDLGEGG